MVLTANGEVLTNNHVIEGANSINVTDVGNGKTYGATVVGYDRTEDVAVLQLKDASGLQTVRLGDSGALSVGEAVVGIGNAGGSGGTPSYAGGSVTALDQSISAEDEADGTSEQLTGLIASDADIEAGDSGGPLVNSSGEVVGMDSAGSSGSGGFRFEAPSSSTPQGFAIPVDTAVSVAKQIESGTSSSTVHIGATAFLGIELEPEGDGSTNSGGYGGGFALGGGTFGSGNSGSTAQGVEIAGAVSGDPAANAGLSEGDTLTSLGGQNVTSSTGLSIILATEKPGQSASLTYLDTGGQQHTVTVTLVSGPPQ
jgi:S1-C subfamily serine protease